MGYLFYTISDAIIVESCVLIKGWSAVNDAVQILVWSVGVICVRTAQLGSDLKTHPCFIMSTASKTSDKRGVRFIDHSAN